MSTRELHLRRRIAYELDGRALRILTDERRHSPQAIKWALKRVPELASFTNAELALGNYEVHRS